MQNSIPSKQIVQTIPSGHSLTNNAEMMIAPTLSVPSPADRWRSNETFQLNMTRITILVLNKLAWYLKILHG